jgi:hypothetical protein
MVIQSFIDMYIEVQLRTPDNQYHINLIQHRGKKNVTKIKYSMSVKIYRGIVSA